MVPFDWTDICRHYRGKWVALKSDHKTVVGSGDTLADAQSDAEKSGCTDVFFTRIPKTFRNFIGLSR